MTQIDPTKASAALRRYIKAHGELLDAIGIDEFDERRSILDVEVGDNGVASVNARYWCDGDDLLASWTMT